MPLTKRERKKRLPRGAQAEIARELGEAASTVSAVVNGKAILYSKETVRKVQEAVALRIGEPVEEVWGTAA